MKLKIAFVLNFVVIIALYAFVEYKFYDLKKSIASNFEGVEIPMPKSIEDGLNRTLRNFSATNVENSKKLATLAEEMPARVKKELSANIREIIVAEVPSLVKKELDTLSQNEKASAENNLNKLVAYAENSSFPFEKRYNFWKVAIALVDDKDKVLPKFIDFVSAEIEAKIKIGTPEDLENAKALYEAMVTTRDSAVLIGTPENIFNAEQYDIRFEQLNNKISLAWDSLEQTQTSQSQNGYTEEINLLKNGKLSFKEISKISDFSELQKKLTSRIESLKGLIAINDDKDLDFLNKELERTILSLDFLGKVATLEILLNKIDDVNRNNLVFMEDDSVSKYYSELLQTVGSYILQFHSIDFSLIPTEFYPEQLFKEKNAIVNKLNVELYNKISSKTLKEIQKEADSEYLETSKITDSIVALQSKREHIVKKSALIYNESDKKAVEEIVKKINNKIMSLSKMRLAKYNKWASELIISAWRQFKDFNRVDEVDACNILEKNKLYIIDKSYLISDSVESLSELKSKLFAELYKEKYVEYVKKFATSEKRALEDF